MNTFGICSTHSPEKSALSKYFSCCWMDDKIWFATAPQILRHPDWLLPDISYWDECFSADQNCSCFMKKTELECFHSKGQFIFFCKSPGVVADLLGPSVSPASFVGKDLSWISSCCCSAMILPGFFILVKKYLIDLNCFSYFWEYLHFLPCLGEEKLDKHLKQILWEC